jgi:hypothetical protein
LLSIFRLGLVEIRVSTVPFTNLNLVFFGGGCDEPRKHFRPRHKLPHPNDANAGHKYCLVKIGQSIDPRGAIWEGNAWRLAVAALDGAMDGGCEILVFLTFRTPWQNPRPREFRGWVPAAGMQLEG